MKCIVKMKRQLFLMKFGTKCLIASGSSEKNILYIIR